MALQYSNAIRIARLDLVESTPGASARLIIYSGTKPTDCAAALAGNTALATVVLPADWMAAASAAGSVVTKAKSGTWEDTSADNTGTATFFRIYDSSITTCHVQGTVGTSGTDMIVDNTSFASGQQFVVTAFTITAANQ